MSLMVNAIVAKLKLAAAAQAALGWKKAGGALQ